jgi:hypothetical protein
MGLLVPQIAEVLSVSHMKVEKIINQHELWRTRLQTEKQKKKPYNRGSAYSVYGGKKIGG